MSLSEARSGLQRAPDLSSLDRAAGRARTVLLVLTLPTCDMVLWMKCVALLGGVGVLEA